MHISPVNISVHTTNPQLRCKMMNNRFAGQALDIIKRFDDAGIRMNFQLVLVPGYNDGQELERSLKELSAYKNTECIASVPVGLTKYRDGLAEIQPFGKETAQKVIDITDKIGNDNLKKYGNRLVYAADEFYLKAEKPIPPATEYGDFPQLDNGVGMWALFEKEAGDALDELSGPKKAVKISCVTGVAAYPLLKSTVDKATEKWHNLECKVFAIENNFFGEKITVAGLVTGNDIINQLKHKDLGDLLLVPACMLRFERDLFLDDVSLEKLSQELGVKVSVIDTDGYSFVEALANG
jgi:putative radical SAM enzyme (TIGR03279 family)